MHRAIAGALLSAALLAGCSFDVRIKPDQPDTAENAPIARLPVAVTNNAVALVSTTDGFQLFSFGGLVNGKTWREVSDRAFAYQSTKNRWQEIGPIPGEKGRLAATAQTVDGQVYLFGGYTVAEDGSEKSTPEVYRLDPKTRQYRRLPDMPVPVDDTVSAVYQDRFIYLVSGWHDDNNVTAVQLLDTQTGTWLRATDFPGRPLFGHAGAIADDTLVICDGVIVKPAETPGGRRSFVASSACYEGTIDQVDPTRIGWRRIRPHPGLAHYRAAAAGLGQRVVFAGGSTNPYNYDGVGYDGVPAPASNAVWAWDTGDQSWIRGQPLDAPSMDHRALAVYQQVGLIVGGMDAQRRLLDTVAVVPLPVATP